MPVKSNPQFIGERDAQSHNFCHVSGFWLGIKQISHSWSIVALIRTAENREVWLFFHPHCAKSGRGGGRFSYGKAAR
jgi:hypothetical protein